MIVSGTTGYDPGLKPYPYDVEAAKKLLTEAGYPNGFDITMRLFARIGRAEGPIIGEAVSMMWQKVGVKAKLEPTDEATFRPLAIARKTPGIAWVYGGVFYEEAVVGYSTNGWSKSTAIWLGAETEELDKLIDKAGSESNDDQRTKLQQHLARYVYDNYLVVPIAVKNGIYGLSNRVGDWPLSRSQAYATNWENITYGPGFKP